ncbi:MAG: hypothetical protein WAM79_23390 [Candidatus Sulfotelmatobacter sp.]
MSSISNLLGGIGTSNYSIDQLLEATQPQPQPSGFRKVLGGIVGGVGNMLMPGIGGLIGNAISGTSGINSGGVLGDSVKYLQLQQEMSTEQEGYEAVSAVVKSRHDSCMDAIRNIN